MEHFYFHFLKNSYFLFYKIFRSVLLSFVLSELFIIYLGLINLKSIQG